MAKIIKIGSLNTTLTSKTANLTKTSRQGSITNPFKFSNFEGNTLQFAEVFEEFEPKKQNKLRMIASSVTGSMNKMRSSITEPIKNFVNKVRGGISNALDYAMNKSLFNIPGEAAFKNFMTAERHLPSIDLSGIGNSISAGLKGKDLLEKWNNLVSKININKSIVPKNASVSEYEQLWKDINAREAVEVAA